MCGSCWGGDGAAIKHPMMNEIAVLLSWWNSRVRVRVIAAAAIVVATPAVPASPPRGVALDVRARGARGPVLA